MLIHIKKESQSYVERKVQSGEFRDAEEAVEIALQRMEQDDQRLAALKAALQVGLDQIERGELITVGPNYREELMIRAKAMIEAGEQPDPDVAP